MELVVVNGASNIAKSVIKGLAKKGHVSKVRLLDFWPYQKGVYTLQRELQAMGIELDKRHTTNA